MSLSKIQQDRGDLTTFQLLLEIATCLQTITSDPEGIKNAAELAFKLSDENEKKAKIAYAEIARAEDMIKEAVRQQNLITTLTEESNQAKALAEQSKADSKEQIAIIQKERNRLSLEEEKQGALALKLSNQEADLKDRESKLAISSTELERRFVDLAEKQKQYNADMAALKLKAEKLRSIVGE